MSPTKKDKQIKLLKAKNAYLLSEITALAAESVKRAAALARLEAEVQALRDTNNPVNKGD